jgi:hypothetical protein
VDPDSSNAGESFGRQSWIPRLSRVKSKTKFYFLVWDFQENRRMSRFNLGYPEQETGSPFFLWLVKRKANSYFFVGLGFSRRTEEGAY